jgi:hypothetical protein
MQRRYIVKFFKKVTAHGHEVDACQYTIDTFAADSADATEIAKRESSAMPSTSLIGGFMQIAFTCAKPISHRKWGILIETSLCQTRCNRAGSIYVQT